jgi:hypothetical protein
VQATKLLALLLVVVLSPRIATADVVRPISQPSVESVASESPTVEAADLTDEAGAPTPGTIAADDSDDGQPGVTRIQASAPRAKKRWGSVRRLAVVRRSTPVIGCLGDEDEDAQPFSTSSFSNCSGVSGLAKR